MHDIGLFPLRQMSGLFDRQQPPLRKQFQEPLAVLKRYGLILLTPDHQYRTRMFPDSLYVGSVQTTRGGAIGAGWEGMLGEPRPEAWRS